MTSPYLQKPRRELDDVVLGRPAARGPDESEKNPETPKVFDFFAGSEWYILCVSALVVCAILAAALTLPEPEMAQFMNAEEVYDIAPAAGPPPNSIPLSHPVTLGADPFDQVLPEGQILTPLE